MDPRQVQFLTSLRLQTVCIKQQVDTGTSRDVISLQLQSILTQLDHHTLPQTPPMREIVTELSEPTQLQPIKQEKVSVNETFITSIKVEKSPDIMDIEHIEDETVHPVEGPEDLEVLSPPAKPQESPLRVQQTASMLRKRKSTAFFGDWSTQEDYNKSMRRLVRTSLPYNIKPLKDKENDASAANAQPRASASPLSAKDSGKKAKFANQDMNRQGLSVGTHANCETRPAGGSMEDQNPDLYSLSHLELTKCRMCHEFFHKPCAFSAHTSKDHPQRCLAKNCKMSFITKVDMVKHANLKHQDMDVRKLLKYCGKCGEFVCKKSFHSDGAHILVCRYCPKKFISKRNLLQHLAVVHLQSRDGTVRNVNMS